MAALPAPSSIRAHLQDYTIYQLEDLPGATRTKLRHLPYSIRILLEGVYRNCFSGKATLDDINNLLNWQPVSPERPTVPVFPGRVVLQDFTGVPVINDLAAMRAAVAEQGGDPARINPVVPVDLVIDHSIQVDYYGTVDAYYKNAQREFERNQERYRFIHWAQKAFSNVRVVPPASGIVHQVNLEYLATLVLTKTQDGLTTIYPDTLVGTDSHTTMINGLGVVAWGVGGIEAVAAMLGEPIEIIVPDVIGVRLTGSLPEGVTPTDLTLTIIQKLRGIGVVDKFVEFFGPGLDQLALADRAMIANITPETGATMLYFPVDRQSLEYLRLTGRPEQLVALVETYYKAQGLYRSGREPEPEYSQVLDVDLAQIQPSLAGPKRPQDRVALSEVKDSFQKALLAPRDQNGFGLTQKDLAQSSQVRLNGQTEQLEHGSVVIAAITSCTNTSNPFVMLSAGLLAKKAVEKGLNTKPYVKTSLAPGSRVVTDYLREAGLLEPLAQLGFDLVGYGCTTCIGNSGPLEDPIAAAVSQHNLVAAAVLSGNRNFEGRIHPLSRASYLASPPLVVAYALAGSVNIDLIREPLGTGRDGQPVYLRDIWPTTQDVQSLMAKVVKPELYRQGYASIYSMSDAWNALEGGASQLYEWTPESTYLQKPPFFEPRWRNDSATLDIRDARVLAYLGDSITTDHISPAGSIALDSPAGRYLLDHAVPPSEFNSYGSRRGNDRVMTRGTLANIRLKNRLAPDVEGGSTLHFPSGEVTTIFEASQRYQTENIPLIILAGKEYGSGSSRDWAAKGVRLLGVRAVIAISFERIHRSNLAGMGVLPLQFLPGESAAALGLTGQEFYSIYNIEQHLIPGEILEVAANNRGGEVIRFKVILRLDTANEIDYYLKGGIMNAILATYQEATSHE